MSDNTINWLDMHKHATTSLEGEFPLVIVEATPAKTTDQSKDMIKCKVKIESGPFVDRPINVNFTISPESPVAMRILFATWAVLGLDQRYFAANPNASLQQIADALVGRRAIGVCGEREWQGRKFDDVKEWKPALRGPGAAVPLGSSVGGPLSGGLTTAQVSPLTTSTPAASGPSPAAAATPERDVADRSPVASVSASGEASEPKLPF